MLEQLQMGKSFVTKDLVWTVQEITGSMCEPGGTPLKNEAFYRLIIPWSVLIRELGQHFTR